MSSDDSFADLVVRLRAGAPDAAGEIFRRFARRLIGLARLHLDARLRQKIDPEDVMQSALKSFFIRHAGGAFDLDSWDSLWSLLTVITLRKCGHKLEHFQAACRDVRRETTPAPATSRRRTVKQVGHSAMGAAPCAEDEAPARIEDVPETKDP